MQDITDDSTALPPVRSEELIISCCQQPQPQPLQQQQQQKTITRSQSSKVIQELQQSTHGVHQLKQQQSLPTPLHPPGAGTTHHPHASKSVSILVYKTLNTVFKSSRKIIVRVCEVASVKKSFTMFKFNKAAAQNRAENRANAVTGHDQFVRPPVSEKKVKHIMKKLHKQNGLKRSNSAIEFDVSALTAANRRHIYSRNRSASSEQDNSDQSEHSEKSPLVSARLDNLARLFFSKSMPAETGSRDTIESVLTTRPNLKYQYSALDSGNGVVERSPRERAHRERALNAVQEWIQNSSGRYEVIAHLDEIGSRHGKNWFLVSDSSVRTDRLMTLLPLPPDCVALEDLPPNENPKNMLMELLGSLHHPYIYPVLDLGFLRTGSTNYACLVTPFNSRGSLKDLIYKAQWNEPWARKYTRKPNGLPVSQVQRLGRQILEALLFLKERGFPLHGHLHSGNVIVQNGAARLSGLENGLLGLSSRINAVMWSRSTTEIENVDLICFGHLLYEMCTGQEMTTPKPSMRVLEMELEHYPQILDVLGLIFEPSSGVCPSVEELVMCDLFRSIDLRELRGPCFNTIKPSLSRSTLNLLQTVKKRQCASLGNSFSETSSPCTPPSTPRDRRSGMSRTMDSFDIISSDSEECFLNEIVVGGSNYYHQQQQLQQLQRLQYCQHADTGLSSSRSYQYAQQQEQQQHESPIHYCENAATHSDDNSCISTLKQQQQQQRNQLKNIHQQPPQPKVCCSSSAGSYLNRSSFEEGLAGGSSSIVVTTIAATAAVSHVANEESNNTSLSGQFEQSEQKSASSSSIGNSALTDHATTSAAAAAVAASAGTSFNHQLTADMCSFKNSKSRRLEYSLKCLKYGRSNPSQDSAFGSLTDNDLSIGSSSFRLSSFQSISSPIDEGVEDVIIATTTAGHETCLELTTIPLSMVSQDSAISSPCRETSPSNFLNIDTDNMSGGSCSGASSSSGSTGNVRPQHFPVSLSPKILVTTTTNSSNSSLASSSNSTGANQQQQHHHQQQQQQQFDPPKILVNDQNSIYTTSPSKRSGTIEVFSQKYRVSSYEDMSPQKRSSSALSGSDKQPLRQVNRLAFRSLEEERRIDNAFTPISDRTRSEQRVNMQSEKYKKLTHASFRISKTSSQTAVCDSIVTSPGSNNNSGVSMSEFQRSTTTTTGTGTGTDTGTGTGTSQSGSSRQTLWRDSKFYRKHRIAKSNDSLLETSPNHSARRSPASLRDNHYETCCSAYASRSHSRQSLNRGSSINEISNCPQAYAMGLAVTTSFCDSVSSADAACGARRYCSSKSEDLGESDRDYLRVMDARKSYSERHLVTLTKLKQTTINNANSTLAAGSSEQGCLSDDEMSFNEDNNAYGFQQQLVHQPRQRQYQQSQQSQQYTTPPLPSVYQQQQQQHYLKRPHPNQLSWSTCSINHLKTTNIRTTSLATLPCHQQSATSSAPINQSLTATSISSVASVETTSNRSNVAVGSNNATPSPHVARNSAFRLLDHLATDSSGGSGSGGAGSASGSGTCTATEENSSPEESPSRQTLSSAELCKIFAMNDAPGSSCSEEKTPLLDSVEMSPISPTEPGDLDERGQ